MNTGIKLIGKQSLVGKDGCGWSAVLKNEKDLVNCPNGDNFVEGVWMIWRAWDIMSVGEMYALNYRLPGKNNWVQACHVRQNVKCQ